MLVAGAFILLLLRVPSVLDSAQEYAMTRTTSVTSFAAILIIISKSIAYILLGNLIVHFVLRCLWVGVIGINSVSEKSGKEDFSNYGEAYQDFSERHWVSLETFGVKLDKFCRVLFGLTFMLLFFMIGVAIQATLVFMASVLIKTMFSLEADAMNLYLIIYSVVFAPVMVVYSLDKWLTKRKRQSSYWKRFASGVYTVSRIINFFTIPLSPIMSTLSANFQRTTLIPIYVGYYIAFIAIITLTFVDYQPFVYFPDDAKELGMDYNHYESKIPPNKSAYLPTIQSDIVSEGYLKLFIPYRNAESDSLKARFPDLKPFRKEGLRFEDETPSKEQLEVALQAFKGFYEVSINDSLVSPASAFFYKHPRTEMPGLMLYISTETLPRGKNLLRVRKPFTRTRKEYCIPFFL